MYVRVDTQALYSTKIFAYLLAVGLLSSLYTIVYEYNERILYIAMDIPAGTVRE